MEEPAEEPVTLAEAKLHLRVEPDVTDDDALIARLITVARIQCENTARRAFVQRACVAQLDCWPGDGVIVLTTPPLISVEGITYTDEDDLETTLDETLYVVDVHSEPGRIVLKRNASWPSAALVEAGAIRIEYTAGYGAAADVPAGYKQAILLYLGHLYENREAVVVGQGISMLNLPLAIDALLLNDRGGY
jgi:uncharacterized phiE125 gp8 family phage protein